jgi:hypothetical protein
MARKRIDPTTKILELFMDLPTPEAAMLHKHLGVYLARMQQTVSEGLPATTARAKGRRGKKGDPGLPSGEVGS